MLMSSMYKKGTVGFVELTKQYAIKTISFNEMYWLNEYAVLLFLNKFKHANVIRLQQVKYITKLHNNSLLLNHVKLPCYQFVFKRHCNTLLNIQLKTDSQIIQVLVDILSAVELCHANNILHRDIKPENIVLNAKSRAILIDFSHAIRIRSKNAVLTEQVVTYTHRAPEVFLYQNGLIQMYDEKIDVWSIGIILFELIIQQYLYSTPLIGQTVKNVAKFYVKHAQKYYLTKLKKIYDNEKQGLSYTNEYWKWITLMLQQNPTDRISVYDMLNTVINFAQDKKINIELPKKRYKSDQITNINQQIQPIQPIQPLINNTVCNIVKQIREICKFQYSDTDVLNVINYVMLNDSISEQTLIINTIAICLIINTSVYDNLFHVDAYVKDLTELSNFMADITVDVVYQAVHNFIMKHGNILLLSDQFTFA